MMKNNWWARNKFDYHLIVALHAESYADYGYADLV